MTIDERINNSLGAIWTKYKGEEIRDTKEYWKMWYYIAFIELIVTALLRIGQAIRENQKPI